MTLTLNDTLSEEQKNFQNILFAKKKYRAIRNYSQVVNIRQADYFPLIEKCLNGNFLGKKGLEFLDEMLDTYEVDWLNWSYKGPWLRKKMGEMDLERRQPKLVEKKAAPAQPSLFDFAKLRIPALQVPISMLANVKTGYIQARAG